MARIVLEDASRGVVNEHEPPCAADVCERERAADVGADGLDAMRLAPVDVGAAGDARGIEHVCGGDLVDVGLELGAVLEAAGAVGEGDALRGAELAEEAPDPAGAAVDEELERRRRGAVGGDGHGEGVARSGGDEEGGSGNWGSGGEIDPPPTRKGRDYNTEAS